MVQQQSRVIEYLLLLVGFIGGYIYYSQLMTEGPAIPPLPTVKSDIVKLKSLEIDFDALEDDSLSDLELYGDDPVLPGQTGHKNIFVPEQPVVPTPAPVPELPSPSPVP